MSILSKYIIKNHTMFMFLTLGIGIAIYIIIDLIEKADIFLAYEGGAAFILPYYIAKLPGILSQILPAVFLLASVVLLCIMIASRETVALFAGGISFGVIAKILIIIGVFWASVQFFCSQVLVVHGEVVAQQIWRDDVRKWNTRERQISDKWFMEDTIIVHMEQIFESGRGINLTAYQLSKDKNEIQAIIRASHFVATQNNWFLRNIKIIQPSTFEIKEVREGFLPLLQNPDFFFVAEQSDDPQKLDFFVLNQAIEKLEISGSNVEDLKTIWFGKIAYSFSIVVFAFVAVAIVTYKENVYVAVIFSVVVTFLAYMFTMIGDSLGRIGSVPPILAAFIPQFLILLFASMRIYTVLSSKK